MSWQEAEAAARGSGVDVQPLEVRGPEELEGLMAEARAGARPGAPPADRPVHRRPPGTHRGTGAGVSAAVEL